MGVEHHLPSPWSLGPVAFPWLDLARISPNEDHPAVTETDVSNLDRRRHPVDDRHLVAPVELAGFARIEAERDESGGTDFGF